MHIGATLSSPLSELVNKSLVLSTLLHVAEKLD